MSSHLLIAHSYPLDSFEPKFETELFIHLQKYKVFYIKGALFYMSSHLVIAPSYPLGGLEPSFCNSFPLVVKPETTKFLALRSALFIELPFSNCSFLPAWWLWAWFLLRWHCQSELRCRPTFQSSSSSCFYFQFSIFFQINAKINQIQSIVASSNGNWLATILPTEK